MTTPSYPANTLSCYVNKSVSQTKMLLNRGFNVTENIDRSGSGSIWVPQGGGVQGQNVEIDCASLSTDKIFQGFVKEAAITWQTPAYVEVQLLLQNYNYYITQITSGVALTETSKTERQIITDLINGFCPSITIDNSLIIVGNTIPSLVWTNAGLGSAINELAALNSRAWWIDANLKIHYMNPNNPEASAPCKLSDAPDYVTTFPYHLKNWTSDINGTNFGELTCWHGVFHVGQGLSIVNASMSWDGSTFDAGNFLITQVTTTLENGYPVFEIMFGSPPKSVT